MRHKELILAFCVSLASYLIFFHKSLNPALVIYSGSDSVRLHYQSRSYIYETLHQGKFPFWTERMLLGFPFYADMERGALNILNLISIFIFGAVNSYKILHLFFYLLGSLSFYVLLKKHGADVFGFTLGNIIYFFSTFMIFHQQHFNIIIGAYLLPLMVLSLFNFLEKEKSKLWPALFIFAFTQIFYFGAFQILLINTIASIIYLLVFSEQRIIKSNLKRLLICFLICFALILPGFIPQTVLYSKSTRTEGSVFSEGSLKIPGLLNLIYPFLFGKDKSYIGMNVSSEYFIHEISIYIGISAFLFFLFLVLPSLEKKQKRFTNILLSLSVFLILWGYMPFFKNIQLIPFSFFRYWVRASYLIPFTISFGFVWLLKKELAFGKKTNLSFIIELFSWIAFFGIIQYFSYKSEYITVIKTFLLDLTKATPDNLVWIFSAVTSLFVIILRKKLCRFLKHTILILIIFDNVNFSLASSYNLYRNRKDLEISSPSAGTVKERLFDFTGNNNSSVSLANGYWNILGYSELKPKNTKAVLQRIGLKNSKDAEFVVNNISGIEKLNDLKYLGVSKVITKEGIVYSLQNSLVDTKYLKNVVVEEGLVKAELSSSGTREINTKITDYPGWTLFVNGRYYNGISKNEYGFIKLNLPENAGSFKLVYFPVHFYSGLLAGSILLLILVFYEKRKQNILY